MKIQPVNDADWDIFAATAVCCGIKAQQTQPETISEGAPLRNQKTNRAMLAIM
jgi:hypothetical protein